MSQPCVHSRTVTFARDAVLRRAAQIANSRSFTSGAVTSPSRSAFAQAWLCRVRHERKKVRLGQGTLRFHRGVLLLWP